MKSWFKCLAFAVLLCLLTWIPIWPASVIAVPPDAEAKDGLPLFDATIDTTEPVVEESHADTAPVSEEETVDSQVPVPPYTEGAQLPCTTGLITYYNQGDPRWADMLYGPKDRMAGYGCGPTALAMVVSCLSSHMVTPVDTAQWAGENGYCSPGEGSRHEIIPDGLRYYGLSVESLTDRSTEAVLNEVRNGKIIIALMNKGYFTNGGHFLLLTQVTDDNMLRIVDPASWENSNQTWDPEFILSQVRRQAQAGGPLWAAGRPPED